MATTAQIGIAKALLQSIVVVLPIWIALIRYVSNLGPTRESLPSFSEIEQEVESMERIHREPELDRAELKQRMMEQRLVEHLNIKKLYQYYQNFIVLYVFLSLLTLIFTGYLVCSFLSSEDVIAMPLEFPIWSPETQLGISVFLVAVIIPVLFAGILAFAFLAEAQAEEEPVNRIP